MEKLLNKIESYGFECQAGPLSLCEDWTNLRAQILGAVPSVNAELLGAIARQGLTLVKTENGFELLLLAPAVAREAQSLAATYQIALGAILGFPIPEQDNMVAANMRAIARDALAAPPSPEDEKAEPWQVHIAGPDDVEFFESELSAYRHANAVNKDFLNSRLEHPDSEIVLCIATVVRAARNQEGG